MASNAENVSIWWRHHVWYKNFSYFFKLFIEYPDWYHCTCIGHFPNTCEVPYLWIGKYLKYYNTGRWNSYFSKFVLSIWIDIITLVWGIFKVLVKAHIIGLANMLRITIQGQMEQSKLYSTAITLFSYRSRCKNLGFHIGSRMHVLYNAGESRRSINLFVTFRHCHSEPIIRIITWLCKMQSN